MAKRGARTPNPAASLSLRMVYLCGPDGHPLPDDVIDYHRRVDREFAALADARCKAPGFSSAGGDWVQDGRRFASEEFWLSAASADDLRPVAERAVALVRRLGIWSGHAFTLTLADDAGGGRVEWTRKVYPNRNTVWRQKRTRLKPRPRPTETVPFPERLGHLADLAGRYFGVGGDDEYGLFDNPGELDRFIAGLTPADRDELVAAYAEVVRRKDHRWLLGWWRENGDTVDDWPEWPTRAHWLLAVLDRLREGGLFGRARTRVVFWDDDM